MPTTLPRTVLVVLVLALALVALMSTAAFAGPPADAAQFGQHVAGMAQNGMLGTDHNPGHHQGINGWQEHHDGMPMPMPMN